MAHLRRFVLRLVNALRTARAEADLDRELIAHLTLLEDDFRRRGLSPDEAARAAHRSLGSVAHAKDLHRDARSIAWLNDAGRDLRYAARMLRTSPGFSAVAILTAALGIGAATTLFSFVNGVLLNPLPYPHSDRLVAVLPTRHGISTATPGDFLEWQAQNRSFEGMAAGTVTPFTLSGSGEPAIVLAGLVNDRFAETLHAAPQIGRAFASEGAAARGQSVILSDHLWRRRFNADPSIIGRSIVLEEVPYTVIAVMPADFSFPRELVRSVGARALPAVDLWLSLALRPNDRGTAFLQVVARLKPGITIGQAQAEMTRVDEVVARQFLPKDARAGIRVVPLQAHLVRAVRPLLLTLFAAVIVLLLIACVNVANLLLGRAAAREREIAVRRALGSGRGRLIRQFLTESVLLALMGGGLGLLVARVGIDLVSALIPPGALPHVDQIHLDGRVLTFSVAVSLTTGLLFGILPALHAGRMGLPAYKGAGTTHSGQSSHFQYLIGVEVTLAFVLLTAAGVLFRSFDRLINVNPGFMPRGLVAADVTLTEGRYPALNDMQAFAANVVERIASTPTIAATGAVNLLPIGGPTLSGDFALEGASQRPGFTADKPAVSPGYFRAMGIPLVRGRDFTPFDTNRTPGVAIVTDAFARRAWPGREPIGKRLKLGFGRPEDEPWLTVVGVIGDVKQRGLADQTKPGIYVPIAQAPRPFLLRNLTFVARGAVDSARVASMIRGDIHAVDPELPIGRIAMMTDLISNSVSEPRFQTVLLGGFGAAALVLISVGMLGVLGYSVARRTREMGIRTALGAQPREVALLVVKDALRTTAIGIAFGAAIAIPATRLLARFLFETSPHDPATLAAVAVILCVAALVASYLPARRAASIDPVLALRAE